MVSLRSNPIAGQTIRLMGRTADGLGRVNNQISSGLRINSAADDPAGLAMSMSLAANIRIGNRATANINDGISALQIVDGALQEISSVVSRLSELSEQSANGSFSATQRSALQQEVAALAAEIYRVRSTVSFNGRALLKGEAVSGTTSTLASGNNIGTQASVDGRYVTYLNSGTLYQKDTETGAVTTIGAGVSSISASSFGDTVAYVQGTSVMIFDRLSGTSRQIATMNVDQIALSGDGTKLATYGRSYFSAGGTLLGAAGPTRNLSIVDTATGQITGDGGGNAFTPTGSTSLTVSNDGSRVALLTSTGGIYNSPTASLNTGFGLPIYAGIVATRLRFDENNALVFQSVSNVAGLNSSGISNLYKINSAETTFSTVTLIRSGPGVSSFFVTDNGKSITFSSSADLVSQNASGVTQLYKVDSLGELVQMTTFTGTEATNLTNVSGDGFTMYTSSASSLEAREILSETGLAIDTGDGASGILSSAIRDLTATVRGYAYFNAATQRNAQLSLDLVKADIGRLSLTRGAIGSNLTRLETAYRSTSTKTIEFGAAQSRIRDLDIAAGVANQTRLSILSETQTGLLASAARLEPDIALQLLRASESSTISVQTA